MSEVAAERFSFVTPCVGFNHTFNIGYDVIELTFTAVLSKFKRSFDTELQIFAEGPDARVALDEVKDFFNNKFGEKES